MPTGIINTEFTDQDGSAQEVDPGGEVWYVDRATFYCEGDGDNNVPRVNAGIVPDTVGNYFLSEFGNELPGGETDPGSSAAIPHTATVNLGYYVGGNQKVVLGCDIPRSATWNYYLMARRVL